jgi:GNAT superfamily N-acetyltransferase
VASTPLVQRPSIGPEYPRWSQSLRDRSHVLIRPITSKDEAAEHAFMQQGLSDRARCFGFLGEADGPGEPMDEASAQIGRGQDVVLAAFTMDDSRERMVGVGRYSTDDSNQHCECTVTIDDEWQGKGLGTVLMRHLIEVARIRGIRRMTSTASAENVHMHDLATHLGFRMRVDPRDPGRMIYALTL